MLRVLMTPLHTRSFRHLPPVPSFLLLVLVDASNTGLAGVDTESLKVPLACDQLPTIVELLYISTHSISTNTKS